jgi:hypothetical protein
VTHLTQMCYCTALILVIVLQPKPSLKLSNMKKIVFPCIMLLLLTSVTAQRKKGSTTMGAYVGSTTINPGSKYKYDYPASPASNSETKQTGFSIGVAPTLGFFVTDDVVIGTAVDLYFSTSKSNSPETTAGSVTRGSSSTSNSNSIGLAPFARFFFGDVKSTLWPYAEIGGGISTGPYTSTYKQRYKTATPANSYNYTSDSKTTGTLNFSGGAKFGAVKMFNPNIGLDFSAGIRYTKSKSTTKSSYKYVYDATTPTFEGNTEYNYTYVYFPVTINVGAFIILGKKK